MMSLSMPALIVSSALRQYVRKERLMEDVEFGLMLAAALDAIHAGEDEWSSRVLSNGKKYLFWTPMVALSGPLPGIHQQQSSDTFLM